MQHSTRRSGTWCKSVTSTFSFYEVKNANSYDELERLWYKAKTKVETNRRKEGTKYDNSRYRGLNLHCLFGNEGHQTVEIRYHSATLNPEKILRWAEIHMSIVNTCLGDTSRLSILQTILENGSALTLSQKIDKMCTLYGISKANAKYMRKRITNFKKSSCAE